MNDEIVSLKPMSRGKFIVLEGIDGCGKSTQAKILAERLRAEGKNVVLTREPGGSPGAEEIRRLLVQGEADRWSAHTEVLLFAAARRDHIEKIIQPALDRGDYVICDRYLPSTFAFQSHRISPSIDVGILNLMTLHKQYCFNLIPNMTFYLRISPEISLERCAVRGGAEARFESKGAEFYKNVLQVYERIAFNPDLKHVKNYLGMIPVDASGSLEHISDTLYNLVQEYDMAD